MSKVVVVNQFLPDSFYAAGVHLFSLFNIKNELYLKVVVGPCEQEVMRDVIGKFCQLGGWKIAEHRTVNNCHLPIVSHEPDYEARLRAYHEGDTTYAV